MDYGLLVLKAEQPYQLLRDWYDTEAQAHDAATRLMQDDGEIILIQVIHIVHTI